MSSRRKGPQAAVAPRDERAHARAASGAGDVASSSISPTTRATAPAPTSVPRGAPMPRRERLSERGLHAARVHDGGDRACVAREEVVVGVAARADAERRSPAHGALEQEHRGHPEDGVCGHDEVRRRVRAQDAHLDRRPLGVHHVVSLVVLQRVQLDEQQRVRVDPAERVDHRRERRVLAEAERRAVVALLGLGGEHDESPVELHAELATDLGAVQRRDPLEQIVEVRLPGDAQRRGGAAGRDERVTGDVVHHGDRVGQRVEGRPPGEALGVVAPVIEHGEAADARAPRTRPQQIVALGTHRGAGQQAAHAIADEQRVDLRLSRLLRQREHRQAGALEDGDRLAMGHDHRRETALGDQSPRNRCEGGSRAGVAGGDQDAVGAAHAAPCAASRRSPSRSPSTFSSASATSSTSRGRSGLRVTSTSIRSRSCRRSETGQIPFS